LDPLLRGPSGKIGIEISAAEEKAILAFLDALTDPLFVGLKRTEK
jgi:hypothetical protein